MNKTWAVWSPSIKTHSFTPTFGVSGWTHYYANGYFFVSLSITSKVKHTFTRITQQFLMIVFTYFT